MKRTLVAVGVVMVAASLAACTSPEKKVEKAAEKVEKAADKVCDEVVNLGAALERYGEITAETPLSEVRSATAELERAWGALGQSLEKLDSAEGRAANAAYDKFQETVQSIPEATSLGDAADQVVVALAELRATQGALQTVECP